jgi:hypothetical protein
MEENREPDTTVKHQIPTVDIQMIIGLFALGYGLAKWVGAGVVLIVSSILLSVILDYDDIKNHSENTE